MKIKDNYQIQFMLSEMDPLDPTGFREIWWRICPKELSLWNRIFHNPWRTLKHACLGDMNRYFNPKEYRDEISCMKTYSDVMEYQRRQWKLRDDFVKKRIDEGRYWPDQL